MRTSSRSAIPVAAILLFLLSGAAVLEAGAVSANPGGITGRTNRDGGAGCAGCHVANASMTVAISGPTALDPNQLGVYTVSASTGAANAARMGVAIAASDSGTPLGVPSGQRLAPAGTGELIHNASLGSLPTAASGTASYTFNYTMPSAAAAGSGHTLYAVAAIGFGGSWKHAANFTVLTRPSAPSSVVASNVTAASVDLAWSGGGPQYRVVYKTGAVAPADESDGTATDVGTGTTSTISGLAPSTQYSFAVFSKLASAVFSSTAASTTATTSASAAAPRYVNAATGANAGSCSSAGTPCRTITYAMAQAVAGSPGDSINVAPGTYDTTLGEAFPIVVKSGVQLLATGSQASTLIDAAGANARVFDVSGANASTAIEGFTIAGGLHQPPADGSNAQGGAIRIQDLSEIGIRRNVFIDNEARGYAGVEPLFPSGGIAYGGAIYSSNSSPTIENNVFHSNTAQGGTGASRFDGGAGGGGGNGHGGALWIFGGAAVVVNNTFVANEARGGAGGSSNAAAGGDGGLAFNGAVESANASVVNNLFAGNLAAGGAGGGGSPQGAAGFSFNGALNDNGGPSTTHNLFFGNTAASNGDTQGANAVLVDPQFHSSSDFRIRLSSPARAAGTSAGAPALDHRATTRPSPPSIGAFEATGLDTSTALASSANPSLSGQAVTFTATVTSPAGTPTGNVAFRDGATPICAAVALSSGQAQCATSSLPVGTRSITAEYAGSGNFAASASTALSQVVQTDFANTPRLANISTRGQVLTGNDVMIGGFIIGGSANKTVVVRARGPSLVPFGITNALANPTLQLVRSSDQATLAVNDDWASAANAAAVTASGFAPSDPLESTILANLPPGAYTAIVSGVGASTGVGIIEVFESDHPEVPLANISTRGQVLTGNDVMIAGFIIQGTGPQTVVVRARGPSLVPFGITNALANPHLQLVRSSDQATLLVNDDWGSASNAAAVSASGFAPSNALEAAILITLDPGAYTAIVTGVGGGTGVGIVEVFAQ